MPVRPAHLGMAAALAAIPLIFAPSRALPAAPGDGGQLTARDALRVCADPNNLPQSNAEGAGYENKIAEALARDLHLPLKYTYFPQRIGFVRKTLRAREEPSGRFKCDVIIGVPYPYELTATTRPYLHSTYALVYRSEGPLAGIGSPDDLLKLPPAERNALRIGTFALTPAADWVLRRGFIGHAVLYPPQSGDPNVTALSTVEGDFDARKIDAAILWGPIAGYLVSRRGREDHLALVPFGQDLAIRFDYEIAMGVRFGEDEWKNTLDRWIVEHRADINRILANYHVPLVP
jgi:quinoprotein dehydrogenase-associated probable ABC transporter substrate-binding protein